MPFNFKVFFLLTLCGLTLKPQASVAQSNNKSLVPSKKTYLFNANFEQVWKATQQVLSSYPLEMNDISRKAIVTQTLNTKSIWRAPFEDPPPPNLRQVLRFRFFKRGFMNTQMTIEKKVEVQKDFLGSKVEFVSSGWEELRIYYKIKREIEINEVLSLIQVR